MALGSRTQDTEAETRWHGHVAPRDSLFLISRFLIADFWIRICVAICVYDAPKRRNRKQRTKVKLQVARVIVLFFIDFLLIYWLGLFGLFFRFGFRGTIPARTLRDRVEGSRNRVWDRIRVRVRDSYRRTDSRLEAVFAVRISYFELEVETVFRTSNLVSEALFGSWVAGSDM